MAETTFKNTTVELNDTGFSKYAALAADAVCDIKSRAGKKGQFLNWIGFLPENQLKNLDTLFDMAQKARAGKYTDIAVLGIGGSRHTTESLVKMLGIDAHAHFYSSVDPVSFERFSKTLDLDKTQFLVVSKSGGTLETTVAYESAKKLMEW